MDDHGRVSAHSGDGDRRDPGGHRRRNRHDDTGEGHVKQNGGFGHVKQNGGLGHVKQKGGLGQCCCCGLGQCRCCGLRQCCCCGLGQCSCCCDPTTPLHRGCMLSVVFPRKYCLFADISSFKGC